MKKVIKTSDDREMDLQFDSRLSLAAFRVFAGVNEDMTTEHTYDELKELLESM